MHTLLVALGLTATFTIWPVPRSDYPSHAVMQSHVQVSNRDFDCNWGLDCDTQGPSFHSRSADELGRFSGWEEGGQLKRSGKETLEFSELGSEFKSPNDADHAAEDFITTLVTTQRSVNAKNQPIFSKAKSWLGVEKHRSHGSYVIVIWNGARELEGVAYYWGSRQQTARHDLVQQARDGWTYQELTGS